MKRFLRFLFWGLLMSLPACEIPFPLDQDAEPRIYLQCIGVETGIRLTPQYAAPVSAPEGNLKNLSVEMQVNGAPVSAEVQADGSFYSSTLLQGGDRLDVSVKADGVTPVHGSTRVPAQSSVLDVQLKNIQVDTIKATRVSLTLDHAPGEGEYFGIQIEAVSEVTYLTGESEHFVTWLTPGYILSAADSGNFDLEDFVQVNYDGFTLGSKEYMPLTLVTRKQFEGAIYSFYLNSYDTSILNGIRDSMPGGDTGVIGGGIVSGDVAPGSGEGQLDPSKIPVSLETVYHVNFFSLSPEFYNYAKALYQSNFDFLSNMGLTPANFTWSNVSGGLGFVGAIIATWVGALEIPEES